MTDRRFRHLRERASYVYDELPMPANFVAFCDAEILPTLRIAGYKQDAKRTLARHAIHNLIRCAFVDEAIGCVADSRDTSKPGNRLRIGVWDAICKEGYARAMPGSEVSKMATRYQATGKLLQLRKEWRLNQIADTPHVPQGATSDDMPDALIQLRTGKFDALTGRVLPVERRKKSLSVNDWAARRAQPGQNGKPDPRAIQNGRDYRRCIAETIDRINQSNLDHSWKAFAVDPETRITYAFQPNVCLRQIHIGSLHRAVRLYTFGHWSGQALPKSVRRRMLIDGKPTAELDFSGMATRMLYHWAGHDPSGDVYFPEQVFPHFYKSAAAIDESRAIVRDFLKRATNICWNVGSRRAANAAVAKCLRDHDEADFLRDVAYRIEGSTPSGIIDRLLQVHAPIAARFFTDVGAELMTTDGRIMLAILRRFADAQKPALGIHDSVLCRASDADFADEVMKDAYFTYMQKMPVVKRVY